MRTTRNHKVNENAKFFRDYKKMLAYVSRHPETPSPEKWRSWGIGQQNLYILVKDYLNLLHNRDILIEYYNEAYTNNSNS